MLVDLINKCKNIVARQGRIIKDADEDEGTYGEDENAHGTVRNPPTTTTTNQPPPPPAPRLPLASPKALLSCSRAQVVAHVTESWINKEDDESYDTGTTIMRGKPPPPLPQSPHPPHCRSAECTWS